MQKAEIELTDHAMRRAKGRSVSLAAMTMALDWGRTWRQPGGRTVHFVGTKDVRLASLASVDLECARHVAAILADDGCVITVIKSRDLRRLRRATFERRPRNSHGGGRR